MSILIWTDGSCLVNPGGPGGWAALIRDTERPGTQQVGSGRLKMTTNQRAELAAIHEALRRLEIPGPEVVIFTDSKYAMHILRGEWEAQLNLDLVNRILPYTRLHRVRFQFVRGHLSDKNNNTVDQMARNAAHGATIAWREMTCAIPQTHQPRPGDGDLRPADEGRPPSELPASGGHPGG